MKMIFFTGKNKPIFHVSYFRIISISFAIILTLLIFFFFGKVSIFWRAYSHLLSFFSLERLLYRLHAYCHFWCFSSPLCSFSIKTFSITRKHSDTFCFFLLEKDFVVLHAFFVTFLCFF